MRDVLRSLQRSPLFGIGAALAFALVVGLSVAVFAAVDSVLFGALPFDRPEELVVLREYRNGSATPSLGAQRR